MSDDPNKKCYTDDSQIRITMPQQMAAACTGALMTSFIVTPFDVVKIRLQSQQKTLLSNKCFLYCNGLMDHLCPCVNTHTNSGQPPQMPINMYNQRAHFNGAIDAFLKISRTEGLLSLWSGLGPTLILAVPATVVYFVSYEQLRLFIRDRYKGIQPVWAPLMAGSMARAWAVTLVSPLELIRTKMQSKRVSYLELGEAIKAMLQHHGIKGLWRGLGSSLLRDVPFSGIYWLHYEGIKSRFSSGTPSFGLSFMAGAVAGSIAAILTTPFDVVKTHQQIELGEKELFSETPKRGSSTVTTFKRIYNQNGLRGLFTGLAPRLVKVAPACAIMISTFEYGKKFFHSANYPDLSGAFINPPVADISVEHSRPCGDKKRD